MRSVGRSLSVLGIAVALTVLAASSALGASPKSFTGVKDCGSFPVPPTCTIIQSSLKILRGAVVTYTDKILFYPVAAPDHLDSDVILRATDKKHSTAMGHCTFWFTGTGHCDYWSGTGKLRGFHASIEVGTSGLLNPLRGTYWFDRDDNNENGDNDN